jgi:hypothetical protein
MDTRQAKKIIKDELDRKKIVYKKLTAKTVSFSDLSRDEMVFVTIHGWTPNVMASHIERIARSKGFRADFSPSHTFIGDMV